MKYLQDLYHWIDERERIRLKRLNGLPGPWTSDPVLREYRFCNVNRAHDRVTQWIWTNWMRPNEGHPNLTLAMGVARMVNLPETLADLGFPYVWNPQEFVRVLAGRKAVGLKCWTSAYMITGGYSKGGESKEVIIARVLDSLHGALGIDPIVPGDTLDVASQKLMVPGIGTFLSAQIIADLKYTPLLADAPDWFSWCAPGPGSTMGLHFLLDRSLATHVSPTQFMEEVNTVRALLESHGIVLDAQNVQNCLCELSKYIRAKYQGRRLKTRFIPMKDSK